MWAQRECDVAVLEEKQLKHYFLGQIFCEEIFYPLDCPLVVIGVWYQVLRVRVRIAISKNAQWDGL